MSPRKRQPAPTDHATMLDLALEDLQRTATLSRELLSRHPERAHAALDLLLFNVGCWEVRWLNVANEASGAALEAMPLADHEGISTADLEVAIAMSERAKELVELPETPEQGSPTMRGHEPHHDVSGQMGHGQAAI